MSTGGFTSIMEEAGVVYSYGEATTVLMVKSCSILRDYRNSHFFIFLWQVGAQLLSVLRNSPFSVICREDVLLGDKPFRCDVTA